MSLPPSHSLVLLVAWWFKSPVRTLSATGAEPQTGGAVRHWPLGGGIPAGDVKRIPARGGGSFFKRGKRRPPEPFVAGESLGPAAGWDKGPRRDTRKVDPP